MKFVLTIDCDNDAFREDTATEIRRILSEELLPRLDAVGHLNLHDINGNRVGVATLG